MLFMRSGRALSHCSADVGERPVRPVGPRGALECHGADWGMQILYFGGSDPDGSLIQYKKEREQYN